ncbi:MAG: hypothetical protein AB1640_24665 [bacterium]
MRTSPGPVIVCLLWGSLPLFLLLPSLRSEETGRTGTPASALLGDWECTGEYGAAELGFRSDGVLVFDGLGSGYSLVPGAIRVHEECGTIEYPYVLQGDALTVLLPEGSEIRCRRVTAAAAPRSDAGQSAPERSGRERESEGLGDEISREGSTDGP